MRSYYAHLKNTTGLPEPIAAKPILRSSAIFPVYQEEGLSTRLLYMGYWFVKRNVASLTQVVTLRDIKGGVIARKVEQISEAKTFRIELRDLLASAGKDPDSPFEGSVEIEFFSLVNLFFPYPAVVVNYYGKGFSTVVHTTQRVYNNYEDMVANSETKVPEAGFNIYADEGRTPFITLINGPESCPNSHLHIECYNYQGHVLREVFTLGDLLPYETRTVDLAELLPLRTFLGNRAGTAKISFDVRWVFPRLLVGNRQRDPAAIGITHTYYDCTRACSSTDYWYDSNPDWHTAALMLPLCADHGSVTRFYFYPIYSPSSFSVDMEIYNAEGKKLAVVPNALHITSPASEFEVIDASFHANNLGLAGTFPLNARLIARADSGTQLPARIKLALDIGSSAGGLPCNICTNLQPYNPAWETKKHSFKWDPILIGSENPEVWIMNSSPKINDDGYASMDFVYYRESDTKTHKRSYRLPAFGSMVVRPHEDPELQAFFEDKIGWLTVVSSNPYTTTYYFSRPYHGVVGGDHGF